MFGNGSVGETGDVQYLNADVKLGMAGVAVL
jgi:hypothetical protein